MQVTRRRLAAAERDQDRARRPSEQDHRACRGLDGVLDAKRQHAA
jgi:hypothetical protein